MISSKQYEYSEESKAPKVELSKPLLIAIKVFHYMGLSTFSETMQTCRSTKIGHLKWCFIHLFVVLIMYIVIFYNQNEIFYIKDNFGKFTDFVKITLIASGHLVSLLETVMTEQSTTEFFRTYSALHQQWANFRQTKREFRIYKRCFLLMLFYITILFGIEMNYLYQIQRKTQWLAFFLVSLPSITICRFRMLQISMYLFLIKTEILQLNKEILELVKSTQSIRLSFIEEMIYEDLSLYMRKYQDIYFMMEFFKKSHSISCLVIFIKTYVKILSDIYWAYWLVYKQDDLHELAEYSLVIPAALNIYLTLAISKDCMNAAKLIAQSLHSLRHRMENLKLSYKIQNFSLQLKHQQIIFDAFGCCIVDCYIVSGVLGSITTYMIFYIQFMPKFESM